MSNPAINKALTDLINQVTRDPNQAFLLDSALESLTKVFVKRAGGDKNAPKTAAVQPQNDAQTLPYLPDEIVVEIAGHLDNARDLGNLRLLNKQYAQATSGVFLRNLTIYPRFTSVARFLTLLIDSPTLSRCARELTLVMDGMKMPEYGYPWAWEDLQNWENIDFTGQDIRLINAINDDHARDLAATASFTNSGGYRTMLGLIFARCPNLRIVFKRNIKAGEHIPGWADIAKFQQLSFYKPTLHYRNIFYGDWQYDTLHYRSTQYKDEFGSIVSEPDAGPQASFQNDLDAALMHANGNVKQIRLK